MQAPGTTGYTGMSDCFIDPERVYEKDRELKREDVKQLQEWAVKQAHLPRITELQMIFFLHSCYYKSEPTKACIETYYTVRASCPEFFSNRNLRLNYADILEVFLYIPLPTLTPEGRKIIFCKLIDTDPDRFTFASLVKCFDMTNTLMLHQQGTFEGEVILADLKSFSLAHLSKLSLVYLKKFFVYFQEAMPVRIVEIHIINVPSFIDKLLALLKPFMKKELYNAMRIHTGGLDDLHKSVPPECLPEDYGGGLDSVDRLKGQWGRNMLANADFFVQEEKAVADESRRSDRARSDGDVFGMEGSFKKLDID